MKARTNNDAIKKQRVELGLEELPPTMYKFKDEKNSDLKKIESLCTK